jgi:hypothetical protein
MCNLIKFNSFRILNFFDCSPIFITKPTPTSIFIPLIINFNLSIQTTIGTYFARTTHQGTASILQGDHLSCFALLNLVGSPLRPFRFMHLVTMESICGAIL